MAGLMDAGVLILRIVLGLIFLGHGSQKIFGWFGGHRMSGHAGFMEALGLRPARLFAWTSALGEFFGGAGILAGLLTPFAAAAIIGSMATAVIKVHWKNGFWNTNGGLEYPLTLATMAFVIGLVGPGRFSAEAALGICLPEPVTYIVVLVLTALFVTFAVTRPRPRKGPEDEPAGNPK